MEKCNDDAKDNDLVGTSVPQGNNCFLERRKKLWYFECV